MLLRCLYGHHAISHTASLPARTTLYNTVRRWYLIICTVKNNFYLIPGDPRICSIPFTTRRPTFKEVKSVMSQLASVYVTTIDRPHPLPQDTTSSNVTTTLVDPVDVTLSDKARDSKEKDYCEVKNEESKQLDSEPKEEVIEDPTAANGVAGSQRKRKKKKNKSSSPQAVSTDRGELYQCCLRGDVEEVTRLLLGSQLEKNDTLQDESKEEEERVLPVSLLHAAVTGSHVDVVTVLLESGVDPSIRYDVIYFSFCFPLPNRDLTDAMS